MIHERLSLEDVAMHTFLTSDKELHLPAPLIKVPFITISEPKVISCLGISEAKRVLGRWPIEPQGFHLLQQGETTNHTRCLSGNPILNNAINYA